MDKENVPHTQCYTPQSYTQNAPCFPTLPLLQPSRAYLRVSPEILSMKLI